MRREARIVAGAGVSTYIGGGRREDLEAWLDLNLAAGAVGVFSFGLCGALDPTLGPGDCIIGVSVNADGAIHPSDADWTERLRTSLPHARVGPIAAARGIVADREAKEALRASSGALAVDLESGIAAHVASRHGSPFAAVRCVSDGADRTLPRAAQAGFGADPDIGAVLRALARRPWELPALIRTALEAEAGFRALVNARHLLGPGLGRLDLGQLGLDVA
jgi:hopanoid-associated phosphorylase